MCDPQPLGKGAGPKIPRQRRNAALPSGVRFRANKFHVAHKKTKKKTKRKRKLFGRYARFIRAAASRVGRAAFHGKKRKRKRRRRKKTKRRKKKKKKEGNVGYPVG
jgi:hypothetical protein